MPAVTGSDRARRAAAGRAWAALRPRLAEDAVAALGSDEADAFLARAELALFDVHEPLAVLYGDGHDVDVLFERALRVALEAAAQRPDDLRRLDRRREIDPGWFQRARMQGYVCYVDRFCGTLAELPGRLDYLGELGTTYLHLMPLLRPRPGENDGGYAVADYRSVDPRLGTMADLEDVARALHARDMSLCIDLVLNPHRSRAPLGAGLAGRRPRVRRLLHRFPRPPDARRLRRHHPRGLPRPGAGLLQLGAGGARRRRRLGVDDVLALSVPD